MDGKMAASDQIKALLADPQLMAALKDKLGDKPADGTPAEETK
jgi:type VI secretion system protein ImpB